jgi:hypothetical protein
LFLDLIDRLRKRFVHVCVGRVGGEDIVFPIDYDLGTMTVSFHIHDDVCGSLIAVKKMADPRKMLLNVSTKSRRNVNVPARKFKLHSFPLSIETKEP